MNITVIIPTLAMGGAEKVALIQASRFADKGHNVTLITLQNAKDFYAVPANIKRIRLNLIKTLFYFNPFALVQRWFLFRKILKNNLKSGIVISHMSTIACFGAWVSGIPFIYAEHSEIKKIAFKKAFILKRALAVIVLSEREKKYYRTQGINAKIIYNPALKPHIKIDKRPSFIKKKMVLAAGRLVKEKGFDILLEAWRKIKDKKDFSLVIAGEGPEKENLSQIIRKNKIERVILAGAQSDMGALYKYADIFVMSSRTEAFPMALLEAMTFGLSSVAFNCTGPDVIIRHGKDGFLAERGNARSLAAYLQILINSKAKRKAMSEKALEITRRFSISSYMFAYENILKSLI